MDAGQQDKVAQFSGITGANPSTAQAALDSANWNLEEAVSLYFAASDDPHHDHDADFDDDEEAPQVPSSSRPQPATSSQPRTNAAAKRPKQMSMRDLVGNGDEDDDEKDDKKPNMFAGGEKSGLAVQNPNQGPPDHFRNIMNQAMQNRGRPNAEAEGEEDDRPQQTSAFTGRAQTLGGDEVESRVVNDPQSAGPQRPAVTRVNRTLHLWQDGVSIDDGPLFRFDDPANQDMMTQINQGRAPLNLLNVQRDQEVDLNLIPHKDEKYVAPKKSYKPFGSQGQRLGSPTPGPGPSASATSSAASTAAPSAATSTSTVQPQVSIDEAVPTLQLQIRLGDGTRLTSRFNTTHTVGDVYAFVNGASPTSTQRPYALMTTFPSKELTDQSAVLGEMGDFKRGGVVVQKWK